MPTNLPISAKNLDNKLSYRDLFFARIGLSCNIDNNYQIE